MNKITLLYPIKFQPILKEKVWGGGKLKSLLYKEASGNIGESWEISGVEGNVSQISNGQFKGRSLNWLIENYKQAVVGEKVYKKFGNKFPLLFKFIDAHEDLSVQLHPDDKLARERHNSFGKTEMWYILNVEEHGRLIMGFNRDMDEAKYLKFLTEKKLPEVLNSEFVKKGDAFNIPPGTVHAIGAGVMLAEIQQTSDITYRIYDWDRPDINGQMRELHNDLALKAVDYSKTDVKLNYTESLNKPSHVNTTKFFEVNKLVLTHDFVRNLESIDSFTVYMCVEGEVVIESPDFSETVKMGETVLIPAEIAEIKFITNSVTLLEVYIP